jgi:hypothetical protein
MLANDSLHPARLAPAELGRPLAGVAPWNDDHSRRLELSRHCDEVP